jgi:hypothetical protein
MENDSSLYATPPNTADRKKKRIPSDESLRWLYGKPPLLPGESEEAYRELFLGFSLNGDFEKYLGKEVADSLMMMRRWRGATTGILDVYQTNPQPLPRLTKDQATKPLPSPDTILQSVPMSATEAAAILAYCSFDPQVSSVLSILQTQELRHELSKRVEAAERTYQRILDDLNMLSEARAHIASRTAYVEYIKARTKHDITRPRQKPSMPSRNVWDRFQFPPNPETPALVDKQGFTNLGRSILGEPPVLKTESEAAYAELYRSVLDYFGWTEMWDSFLANDVAAATWEMRRLREAAETIFCFFFQAKGKQMLEDSGTPIGEMGKSHSNDLLGALNRANVSVGHVTALASGDLAHILSALDDEIAGLEKRRRRAIRSLVASRARSVKSSHADARRIEALRQHEWKVREVAIEFNQRYGRWAAND